MMLFPTFLQIFYFLFFMNCFYKQNKSKHLSFFLLLGTTILLYFCNYKGISILGKVVLLLSLFLYTIYIFDGSIKKKLQTLLLGIFVISSSEFIAVSICNVFEISINLKNIQLIVFLTLLTQMLNYLIGGSIINLFCDIKYFRNIFYLSYPFILIIFFLFSIDFRIFVSNKIPFIFVLFILFTFVCIITVSNMSSEIKKMDTMKKIEKLKIEEEFLISKYEFLDENYHRNFKYFHELLHCFNELTNWARDGKYNEIINRIDSMSKQTFKLFSEIYSNSPILSSLIMEYKDVIDDRDIVIIPTIKNERMTTLSLLDETNMFRFLFEHTFNIYSKDYLGNKMILIKSDMIGQQRIVTFSFTSNVENEENLNKLISNVKQYTKRVKAEYIDKLEITEIILIF